MHIESAFQEMSLYDALQKAIDLSKEGYVLSTDTDKYPVQLGSIYCATMVKPVPVEQPKPQKQVKAQKEENEE